MNSCVSVIMPVYNTKTYLGTALDSVLKQSWVDFEIIIVDDGSTDNTKKLANDFNDERIRYVRHEQNKGEAASRNTGIKLAKGDYIASQDSDDEWLPGKLARQVEVFENSPPEVGVVYTGF
ncbi:MAG: glycosyltransferase family 2 protein, partial [Candidatus Omnitrophica bacterium]|nr:glycosyltransferase family 2 protein [Candidatus Omnitrophota bacterium]